MNPFKWAAGIMLASLLAVAAQAQEDRPAGPPDEGGPSPELNLEVIEQFDANSDGELNDNELGRARFCVRCGAWWVIATIAHGAKAEETAPVLIVRMKLVKSARRTRASKAIVRAGIVREATGDYAEAIGVARAPRVQARPTTGRAADVTSRGGSSESSTQTKTASLTPRSLPR